MPRHTKRPEAEADLIGMVKRPTFNGNKALCAARVSAKADELYQ
jgi:hypothetical protein